MGDSDPGAKAVDGAGFAPWSKRDRIALLVLAIGVLASLSVLVHPWYDSIYGDSAIYIATARSLAAGEGYLHLAEPHRIRPPGFSFLLSPWVGGELGGDFRPLNLFVSLFGAAAVLLLFALQRARVGAALAFLTAAAVWLNPGFQRLCNLVMSDVPGLTLLLGCLLVERWNRRAPSTAREIVLGLCIGLSAYVRSSSLVLIPAIAAARWFATRATWRGIAIFAGVAVLVVTPWVLRNALVPASAPPSDQTFVYSYATGFLNEDPGDPASPRFSAGEIAARIPAHGVRMLHVLGNRMSGGLHVGALDAASGGFAALLTLSWLYLLFKRRGSAEFSVFFSLTLLLPYFAFRDRLLLPIYVLAFAASVEALRDLLQRLGGKTVATVGVAALLLGLIALDFAPREHWDTIRKYHRAYAAVAAAVAPALNPDDRIAAGLGQHYAVHLGRPVYSFVMAIRRDHNRLRAADAIVEKYGIDTILLSPLVPFETEALLPHFERRYGPAQRLGPAYLIRVPDV